MSMNSLQLDAFTALAQSRSFSEAARRLYLTQSALSQRILKLEAELKTTLFLRDRAGAKLTESGKRLLNYCQSKGRLESEFLAELAPGKGVLTGQVRVAGFSTFVRPLLIPAVGEFCRKHPGVEFHVQTQEDRELLGLLTSGAADYVFTLRKPERGRVEFKQIGEEVNVLVTSLRKDARQNVYLDHDEFDPTTADFWKLQKTQPTYRRVYFDEVYAILDAVEAGLGGAVLPLHMISGRKLKQVGGLRPLKVPIYLAWKRLDYYTRLDQAVIEALTKIKIE